MPRRVTANMDQRFPDATPADLERSDNICIICREEMTEASRNKKLACNHVFHLHCLRYGYTLIAPVIAILREVWRADACLEPLEWLAVRNSVARMCGAIEE